MIVRVLGAAATEWSEFLGRTLYDFYHLPAYARVSATQEQGEARALLVDDGPRLLLLPLIVRPIPASDRRDVTSPYGYPGPLVRGSDDPRFLSEALAAGIEALRQEGIVSAFVRFHPILNTVLPTGVGDVVVHGHTVSVDLSLSREAIWTQTRRNHRREIKRALESGCVASMDPGFTHFGAFQRLYRETMERRHAVPYYFFGDDYFGGLRDALGDSLHLSVVEKDGTVIAASLVVETCGIVQHHLMGSAEAPLRAAASKLMVHFLREWASARGNRWFHLGGGVGGEDDSLLHFKSGFSPVRHPFATLRAIIDVEAYDHFVRARGITLDPMNAGGFFPAYRIE